MATAKKFRPRSAPSVARVAPGTEYRPPGSPQGASRRAAPPSRPQTASRAPPPGSPQDASGRAAPLQGKASLNERYNRLQQNMERNLEMMREHREHTAHIKQNAREQAERVCRDLRSLEPQEQQPSGCLEGARDAESSATLLGRGHMKQRCVALEEHCYANGKMLYCHRTALDEVHALKRAQAAERGERYEGGATKRPASAAPARKAAPNIWEDHWWMQGWPPSGGTTAVQKTRAVTQANTFCRRAARASSASSSAPGAAVAAALRKGAGAGSCTSLATDAASPSDPGSTGSLGAAEGEGRAQVTTEEVLRGALGEDILSQEDEAALHSAPPMPAPEPRLGWSSSRPPSAGSLKARTAALEQAAKRNKEMLASNRQGIEMVARLRQARTEKLCSDFARDMPAAMQVQPT